MKSIKPGRGPSMIDGIVGIFVALFGVFWTILAIGMGAGFMAVFGIIFVIIAVIQVIYNFKNATGENRYSEYDIVEEQEEADPFNERFGKQENLKEKNKIDFGKSRFCPYCGALAEERYVYCNKCGKKLP